MKLLMPLFGILAAIGKIDHCTTITYNRLIAVFANSLNYYLQ